jgi:hypothetical protein
MKRTFTLILLAGIFASFTSLIGIEDVVASLKSGNVSQMAKYFDKTVEIALPEKSSSYSKSQAETILRDFLGNKNIKSFQVIHKGDNGGSQFCIGKLVTQSASYRTTVFMKQKGDKQVLQEIRFEN